MRGDARQPILERTTIKGDPVIFDCGHAEAHFVDGKVLMEFRSGPPPALIRLIMSLPAREALNFAHQIENAFHQGVDKHGQ